jgi:hypothetical protein
MGALGSRIGLVRPHGRRPSVVVRVAACEGVAVAADRKCGVLVGTEIVPCGRGEGELQATAAWVAPLRKILAMICGKRGLAMSFLMAAGIFSTDF